MASISLTFSDADDGQAGEGSERVDAKRLLAVIGQDRHAERNRAVFMLSLLAGFRACEVRLDDQLRRAPILAGWSQPPAAMLSCEHRILRANCLSG